MDTTKLIEEAGRVAAQAAKQSALDSHYSPCTCSAPPRGHTTRQHDYRRLQVDELRAVLDVIERLTAALKASEERARKAEELAAANLAANKRIVELEQEADRLITQRDRWEEQVGDMAASAGCEEEFSNWHDHKDCVEECVAVLKTERDAARAELARLTTPRPIAEAPRTNSTQIIALWMDGDVVESMDVVVWADMDDGDHPERKFWMNMAGDSVEHMTHYLPLPEVKP